MRRSTLRRALSRWVLPAAAVAVGASQCLTGTAQASGTWSAPIAIDSGNTLESVSCPTTTFCAAVDTFGEVVTWDGSTWTSPTATTIATVTMRAVSCPTDTFCTAVDTFGGVATWDGSTWSSLATIDPGHITVSVSCPTATFCVSVDMGGGAVTDTNGTWATPTTIDGGNSLDSVSCPTTTFCAAADVNGNEVTYTAAAAASGGGGYRIGGFQHLPPGTHWQAGTTHTLIATLTTSDGLPAPGSLAASIASHCELFLTATGAQRLTHACLRYHPASATFSYRWHLRPHAHGGVTLALHLTYPPAAATTWAHLAITPRHHQAHAVAESGPLAA